MAHLLPRRLLLIAALFVVRGAFYCTLMPLWEGFDEYAHFARFDQTAVPRSSEPMTREIEETFSLAPLPDQLQWMGPWVLPYRQWWTLPEPERTLRMTKLRSIPPSDARVPSVGHYDSYEAQQPPLYYWILSIPLRFIRSWNLVDRVMFLRFGSVLLAAISIPLTYLTARKLLNSEIALAAAGLMAVSPMYAVNSARVANDALAVTSAALVLFVLSRENARWWELGMALGVALLAKAFLLALIPAVVMLWWKRPRPLFGALAASGVIAGWWYIHNLLTVGKLTGWEDDAPPRLMFLNAFHVDWPRALGSITKTAIWFGGWSFLTAKAWTYDVLLFGLLLCAVLALRHARRLAAPLAILGWFALAMAYDATAEFTTHQTSSAPGWYCWAIGSAVSIVIAAGAGRFVCVLLAALAAFDLYTANGILLPYYSGFASHGHGFAHGSQWFEAMSRLHIPLAIFLLEAGSTLALPLLSCAPGLRYTKPQS